MKALLEHDTNATIVDEHSRLPQDTTRFLKSKEAIRLLEKYYVKPRRHQQMAAIHKKNRKNLLMMGNISGQIQGTNNATKIKDNISSS